MLIVQFIDHGFVELLWRIFCEPILSLVTSEYFHSRKKNHITVNIALWVLTGCFLGLFLWGVGFLVPSLPGQIGQTVRLGVIMTVSSLCFGFIGLVTELIRFRNKPQLAIQRGTFQNSPRTKNKKRSRRRSPPV